VLYYNISRYFLILLPFLEDCSCFGYKFKNHHGNNDEAKENISFFLASEVPECAVVRVSEQIPEGVYPVALQYSLERDKEKFLTQGGKVALQSLYESIPVHSSINIDKFFSRHALQYCNTFENDSTPVLPCVDRPYFYININTRSNRDALTPTEYFLIKYGISIVFCVLLLLAPYVASAYKHSHVQ